MPRTARRAPGGMLFRVINRGVGRQQLFFDDDDYEAFERVIAETLEKRAMRILAYFEPARKKRLEERIGVNDSLAICGAWQAFSYAPTPE